MSTQSEIEDVMREAREVGAALRIREAYDFSEIHSEARRIVRRFLEIVVANRPLKPLQPSEILGLLQYMVEEVRFDLESPSDLSIVEAIVEAAIDGKNDPKFVDFLTAQQLETGAPLPPVLRFWAVIRLRGFSPKRNPGKHPLKYALRHGLISGAVRMLVRDFGMKPTRNEIGGGSACDIVAEVAGELGIDDLSYKAVEKIWNKHRKKV